jgi:predicted nucleic acid-binding protein
MTLAELPDDARVFVDANIFGYHFTGVSAECKALLEKAARNVVQAKTGAHILLEVLQPHGLMMIEAVTKGLISPSQPAKKLKQQWQVIQRLRDYDRCVTEIPALNIEVLPLTGEIIRESSRLRSAHGLMTNDSVTAAMMAHHGMSRATTLDSDLQRVPGLSLYQPTDIP